MIKTIIFYMFLIPLVVALEVSLTFVIILIWIGVVKFWKNVYNFVGVLLGTLVTLAGLWGTILFGLIGIYYFLVVFQILIKLFK